MRFKLFLSYMLVSILPIFVLWGIISAAMEEHLLNDRLEDIRFQTHLVAVSLNDSNYINEPTIRPVVNAELRRNAIQISAGISILDSMTVVIFNSQDDGYMEGSTWPSFNVITALEGTPSYSVQTNEEDLVSIEYAAPIFDGYNNIVGAVVLSHIIPDAGEMVAAINNRTIWLVAAIGIVVAVLVLAIASWLLKPLKEVLSAVKNISDGHLNQRIELSGKDEITALADAVNDMTQKLENTENTRQEFVSNVSHELKTPLSAIKVLSESLLYQDDVEKETYKEFLWDINSEVDRMSDIINELLTLVRLDETELPLNITPFTCNSLLEGIIKRLKPLADQKDIKIDFNAEFQIDMEADEMKLNLALSNIIENAIKYSHQGGLVEVMLDSDSKNAFITVVDQGIGIEEESQDKVFYRFFRADKGRDRESGGTGLGLAITHKAILLHKGSIRLSSKVDEGSIFTVRVPLVTKL
ncbi:MAG: HAMP domain-containing histidine kinase [Defluviitaleaceae bacterium]|nr:HAMP domain-containing histidine kinase [Defluviitaleaceae bacterium]